MKKEESVLQTLRNGQTMMRTQYVIADETSAINLTLWGPPDQITEASTYSFSNVTVKTFEIRKLCTNSDTAIKRVQNLENISNTTVYKAKLEVVKIVAVKITTMSKCSFCNSQITLNDALTSVKCPKCLRRQLNESVLKFTKCEITGQKKDDNKVNFLVPESVLTHFTGEMPNDDRELYILNCKEVQVTFASNNTNMITDIKKMQ